MARQHRHFNRLQCIFSFLGVYCLHSYFNTIIILSFLLSTFYSTSTLFIAGLEWASRQEDRQVDDAWDTTDNTETKVTLESNGQSVFLLCWVLRPLSSVPWCRSFNFHFCWLSGPRLHSHSASFGCISDISLENKLQQELTSSFSPRNQVGIPKWCHLPPSSSPRSLVCLKVWPLKVSISCPRRAHWQRARPGDGGCRLDLASGWGPCLSYSCSSAWKLFVPIFPEVKLMWLYKRTWHFLF